MVKKKKAKVKARRLTPKQEDFCQKYIECKNASDAYRLAYDCEGSSDTTVNRAAKELMDNPKIAPRIETLQQQAMKRHNITLDSLTENMAENRELARQLFKPETMQSADMGMAKLHGLLNDKVTHEVGPETLEALSKNMDALEASRIYTSNIKK